MAKNLGLDDQSSMGASFRDTLEAYKGTADFKRFQEEWVNHVQKINDLTDEYAFRLGDLVDKLGTDLLDNLDEIEDFLEYATDSLNIGQDTVEEIRNLFSQITDGIRGSKGELTDKLNLVRNIRNVSKEIEQSLQIENGATKTSLENLTKKAQKAQEAYEWTVKDLVRKAEEEFTEEGMFNTREKIGQKVRDLQSNLVALKKEEFDLQKKLQNSQLLLPEEKIRIKDRVKELQELRKEQELEIKNQRTNLELLSAENLASVRNLTLKQQTREQIGREVRRKTVGTGFVAGLAEKLGVSGAKNIYENYVQKKILVEDRKQDVANAQELGKSEEEINRLLDRQVEAEQELKEAGGNRLGVLKLITKEGLAGLTAAGLAFIVARKVWSALKDVSTEAAKVKQATGYWYTGIAAANYEFATSKQWLETVNNLANQFYINPVTIFSKEEIGRMAEARNLMGMSADQVGNLGIRAKTVNQNIDQYNDALVRGINNGNILNRSTVAGGVALKEAASISDDLALSLGNSGEAIGRAVVAANALGLSLKDVDNVAEQMLNFESSIENEMKAQLLTGNQMNLARARGLALQNDLEGVAREIGSQGMTAAKFAGMNRIQQEGYAKAIGLSREQLGRMLVIQTNMANLTDAQLKAATGLTREQLQAASISDRWKIAVDKLVQAFTPLLELIIPAITVLSKGIQYVAGAIGYLLSGLQKVEGLFKNTNKSVQETSQTVTTAGSSVGKLTAGFLLLGASGRVLPKIFRGIGSTISKVLSKLSEGVSKTLGKVGEGIGDFLDGLSGGMKGIPVLLAISAAVIGIGFAIRLATPGIEALGKLIKSALEGVGTIIVSVAKGFFILTRAVRGLTLADIGKLALLGPILVTTGLAAGLTSGMFLRAGLSLIPFTRRLKQLGTAGTGIGVLASNINTLSLSIANLKGSLQDFETEKLKDISRIAVRAQVRKGIETVISTVARPVSGGITTADRRARESQIRNQVTTERQTEQQISLAKVEKLLETINSKVSPSYDVYLDVDKVGQSLATRGVLN